MKERYTMMRRAVSLCIGAAMCVGLLLSYSSIAAAGANKVKVCHIPPGNPDNFHTITISEKAIEAHLAHGDIAGSCDEHCEALCDDGNECSIDACAEGGGCDNSGETNCDDYNDCTINSCDSVLGCIDEPVDAGEWCDDGKACTDSDVCDGAGTCEGIDNPQCCFTDDLEGRCNDDNECTTDLCDVQAGEETGLCQNDVSVFCPHVPCSTNVCNETTGECDSTFLCEPPDACSGVECVDETCMATGGCEPPACKVGSCDDMSGECTFVDRHCPLGTECNPDTNACEATPECPCWAVFPGAPTSIEALWTSLAPICDPANPSKDVCQEVSAPFPYSTANCVSADNQSQVLTQVRDFGTSSSVPPGTRYRCIGRYRAPGVSEAPILHLSRDEFDACLAEHDEFTATTNFPTPPDTFDRAAPCGLPTPGVP